MESKYRNHYLKLIQKTDIPEHKIYEYLYALELNMVDWDNLPPDFDAKFDLPHKMDYGVDLVDLNFTKTCQVKKYDGSFITWSHLCKFKTYSQDVLGIDDMILATTKNAKIDRLGYVKLIDTDKIKLVRCDYDELFNKYSKKIVKKQVVKGVRKIEKRDYLLECYNTIVNSKCDVKCQLPCGTGKSFIILHTILEQLKVNNNFKFIVFVPWLDLATQMNEIYNKFIKCVLIGNSNTDMPDDYDAIICINPSVVHIDKNIQFRYIFIDEAHHLENEDSKIRAKIAELNCDKIIHFSATFKTNDVDYNYPLDKAIDNGYVTDYKLHFMYFTDGDKMNAIVDNIKSEYFPMFVYFNSTKRSLMFHDKLKQKGFNVDYLNGTSSDTKRNKVKKGIESGKIDILSLCGVYNEGVSIDCIRTIMFGDLRHSDINKIQIMMRACRLHKDKPFYRIIVPVCEKDFAEKDIAEVIQTFCKVDVRLKKAIRNKSNCRIKIENIGNHDADKTNGIDAELLYEQMYDRLGRFIEGKSNEERWTEKLEAVRQYIDENKKRPSSHDKNAEIKQMGQWIITHIKKHTDNTYIMKKQSIKQKWEKFIEEYSEYFMSNEERWNHQLKSVRQYINKNKKRPSPCDKNAEIRQMGRWIYNQVTSHQNNRDIMKNQSTKQKWEKFIEEYSEYFMSDEEQWNQQLKSVRQYINKNTKRPSPCDKNAEIKQMCRWINSQITNYNNNVYIMKNQSIKQKWEKFIEEYSEYFMSNEERWAEKFEAVRRYIDENKKRPSNHDKNAEIAQLSRWIGTQIKSHKNNIQIMKTQSIKQKWEKFIKEYSEYFMSCEERWEQQLKLVRQYIDENKKRPSLTDKNAEIQQMGRWAVYQLQCYKNNKDTMKKMLIKQKWEKFIEEYSEYFMSDEERWEQQLKSVRQYINKNKKKPSVTDKNAEIRQIGQWTHNQTANHANNTCIMKNQSIKQKWEKFIEEYSEYFMSNEERWNHQLKSVRGYIDENKKRPSASDKNTGIKQMGQWVIQQTQNYKNNSYIMKNPLIKQKWEAFVESHQQYFN